jgi:tetratricopeptide (TPR) repeat protein
MSEELYKKGLSLANIEDYEEAIRYFDRAVKLDPNNAPAIFLPQVFFLFCYTLSVL